MMLQPMIPGWQNWPCWPDGWEGWYTLSPLPITGTLANHQHLWALYVGERSISFKALIMTHFEKMWYNKRDMADGWNLPKTTLGRKWWNIQNKNTKKNIYGNIIVQEWPDHKVINFSTWKTKSPMCCPVPCYPFPEARLNRLKHSNYHSLTKQYLRMLESKREVTSCR